MPLLCSKSFKVFPCRSERRPKSLQWSTRQYLAPSCLPDPICHSFPPFSPSSSHPLLPKSPLLFLRCARHAPVSSLCTVCSPCLQMPFPQRTTRLAYSSLSSLCSNVIFSLSPSHFFNCNILSNLPPVSLILFYFSPGYNWLSI